MKIAKRSSHRLESPATLAVACALLAACSGSADPSSDAPVVPSDLYPMGLPSASPAGAAMPEIDANAPGTAGVPSAGAPDATPADPTAEPDSTAQPPVSEPESPAPDAPDCAAPAANTVQARLLSGSQYKNTVLDLFGVSGDVGADLGDSAFDTLDDVRIEQRADAAGTVAREAATNLSRWAPCIPAEGADPSACQTQIIDEIGSLLFRRPLTTEDTAQMAALFDAGIAEADFSTGVEWFLTGALQSPDFMYEIVRPQATETPGEVLPLEPHEYASRLAYFIWDTSPDRQLLAAATAGQLTEPADRQAQLELMLQDDRFLRGVESFYRRWLNADAFSEIARDAEGFDHAVAESLAASLLMSATAPYAADAPNISELFSGESYYLNDVLSSFYGQPAGGSDFALVTMPGEGRRGILTHPALMAQLARPQESFPIGRGLFVVRNLLCFEVPLPDGLEIPELPPIQEGLSTRERLEAHTADPVCATCHAIFDPPGFALENFDEVGRYRTVDHGKQVVTSGAMRANTDIDGDFEVGDELLARIAESEDVRACFAQRYMEFALARYKLSAEDECSLANVEAQFSSTGNLKQLVALIAESDAFRLRLAEGVAQ